MRTLRITAAMLSPFVYVKRKNAVYERGITSATYYLDILSDTRRT